MLKMKSILHTEVNGREFELSFAPDSPINDILEANNQINAFILGKAEQARNAQAAQQVPPMPEMPPVQEEVPQG